MRETGSFYTFKINGVETNYVDHYLLREFEVVGIIGSGKISDVSMRNSNEINTADIIVSGASYYSTGGSPAILDIFVILVMLKKKIIKLIIMFSREQMIIHHILIFL